MKRSLLTTVRNKSSCETESPHSPWHLIQRYEHACMSQSEKSLPCQGWAHGTGCCACPWRFAPSHRTWTRHWGYWWTPSPPQSSSGYPAASSAPSWKCKQAPEQAISPQCKWHFQGPKDDHPGQFCGWNSNRSQGQPGSFHFQQKLHPRSTSAHIPASILALFYSPAYTWSCFPECFHGTIPPQNLWPGPQAWPYSANQPREVHIQYLRTASTAFLSLARPSGLGFCLLTYTNRRAADMLQPWLPNFPRIFLTHPAFKLEAST